MRKDIPNQKEFSTQSTDYSYDEILSQSYKLVLNTDYYQLSDGLWVDRSEDDAYMKQVVEEALEVGWWVSSVLPRAARSNSISGSVGYTSQLMEYLIEQVNDSAIVKAQQDEPRPTSLPASPSRPAKRRSSLPLI